MKEDPNQTRITIGRNSIDYPEDCGTKTGSLELVKLMINSVCSRPNAKFMTMDLGNFYIGTPLDHPEYVCIKLSTIPQECIDEYDLLQFVQNGWVYSEVSKGMYGLNQAGKLFNDWVLPMCNHTRSMATQVATSHVCGHS